MSVRLELSNGEEIVLDGVDLSEVDYAINGAECRKSLFLGLYERDGFRLPGHRLNIRDIRQYEQVDDDA